MKGRRVLVVGASAGIGRAFAVHAVRSGAQVVLAARRRDALAAAVEQAGGGLPVVTDVGHDGSLTDLVTATVEALGGIDLAFSAAGRADLRPLAGSVREEWAVTLDTNVVGVNQLIRFLVPHLPAGAIVAALSSETVTRPWPGLGVYAASKAALDAAMAVWRLEHPGLRFSTVAVGPTQPTEFGAGFDAELLGPSIREWKRRGLMSREYMDTDEVAAVLVGLYGVALDNPSVGVEHVVLRSPSPLLD